MTQTSLWWLLPSAHESFGGITAVSFTIAFYLLYIHWHLTSKRVFHHLKWDNVNSLDYIVIIADYIQELEKVLHAIYMAFFFFY